MKSLNPDASVVQRAALRSFYLGVEQKYVGKKLIFSSFPIFGRFFVVLSLLPFLALSGDHSSLSFVPSTASQPTKLHICVAHIPPPLLHLLRLSLSPLTP